MPYWLREYPVSEIESASRSTPLASKSRWLFAVLIGVALAAFLARVIPEPRTIDDAFITFRYSRNLVAGEGFVYNPGTRTLGTTTPLYTLLMAAVAWITGSGQYPWFALVANALFDAATAALLAWLIYRVTGRTSLAAILGILWAVSPMSVTFAVGGMETSLGIFCAVAAISAYLEGRERWMAVFAALAILTRIDTVIWVGPLFLHQAVMHWRSTPLEASDSEVKKWVRRIPWQSWMICGMILLPWFGFSWAYFGSLVSRSMAAKRLAYQVAPSHALVAFLQHAATPFFENETLGVPGVVIGLVLYPSLAAVGLFYAIKRQPRLIPFLIYPWLYVTIFSAANPLIFRWYLAPILPAYFTAILLGVWALADSITVQVKRPSVLPPVLSIIGAVFILFSLNAWVVHPDHQPDRPAPDMAWHKIELNYKIMGDLLRTKYGVTAKTVVAAGDIGAVGYYSRAHILDTVGLVTPEISKYYPFDKSLLVSGANYAVPPAIILDYRPDYIVLMEDFVHNGLARSAEFNALYAQVEFIPTDYYGTGMILYQRRDLSSETPAAQKSN